MLFTALWFATYPMITFGKREILTYRLFDPINSIMAVFRCNGRGIWVITYTLMIGGFVLIVATKERSKNTKGSLFIFLILCLVLQIADLSPLYEKKYFYCNNPRVLTNCIEEADEIVKELSTNKYKHMFLDESLLWAEEAENFAVEHHLTTNRFYLARQNEEANARRNEEGKKNLSKDTLYVFPVDNIKEMEDLGLEIIFRGDYNVIGVLR